MRKLITKLAKNGYEVIVFGTENGTKGFNIIQNEEKYAPTISDKFGAATISETEFRIETVSYGGLEVDEIREMVAGYEKAVEAAEYFKKQLIVIEQMD